MKTVFADESFTSQEYDTLGRRVGAIDQNGKRTEYRYDDLGRLTGVKNAIGDWTSYGYNAQGQLMSMTDAEGRITRYEYDSLGRRSDTYLPLNQSSSQTYDEVGNLKTSTDFNGKTIAYGYDAQNRLTSKSFADGTKVTYSYTFNGLQDKVTFLSATGAVTAIYDYDYDVRDRLIKRTDTIDGVARAIEYGYDIGSNRTSVTTASGTTTYTYDERNRLDVVKQNGVLAADYDYDAISNLTQTTFGNGTRENRSYDTLNRLTTLETKRLGDNTPLSKYVYTLDKVGNRKSVTETQNGQGRSISYTYDDLYRLTKESIADTVNGDRSSSYVYDKVGNRLGKTVNEVTTAYVYDGNDRLLNEKVNGTAIVTYGYDNNGSTIAKTENGVTSTYVWNDDKRLVSATVNGKAIGYRYNDQGIRVSSTVDGVETRYLLDEGITANVWEEYSPNGSVQASYVYGYDLISQVRSGVSSFYLVDGLGSTRLLTDTQGQVLNAYGYEAFGETVSQSGTATNAYQYAGEQFDGAIGDYYLRQRFYDPSSGRFGRMDKYEGEILNPLSLNRYLYGNSNPITNTDPSGYFTGSLNEFTTTKIGFDALVVSSTPVTTVPWVVQNARGIALFFALLAVAVTAYPLSTEEMEEWVLDAKPKKGNKNQTEYKLFPADRDQRKDIDKDWQMANQMRVQAQTELAKNQDVGIPLFASSKIGVTKAQVAAGLTILWDLRQSISFITKKFIPPYQKALGKAWDKVQKRTGSIDGGGEQAATSQWNEKGEEVRRGPYRVDVENIRGKNLRF